MIECVTSHDPYCQSVGLSVIGVSKSDILYDCMIEHAVKRLRNEANEKADCTRPRHVYERDKTRRRNKIAKSKNQVFRPPDRRTKYIPS